MKGSSPWTFTTPLKDSPVFAVYILKASRHLSVPLLWDVEVITAKPPCLVTVSKILWSSVATHTWLKTFFACP